VVSFEGGKLRRDPGSVDLSPKEHLEYIDSEVSVYVDSSSLTDE
jgi:hypothetical protein